MQTLVKSKCSNQTELPHLEKRACSAKARGKRDEDGKGEISQKKRKKEKKGKKDRSKELKGTEKTTMRASFKKR